MKGIVRVRYQNTALKINCGQLDEIAPEESSSSFSSIREMYSRNVYLHCFDTRRIRFENAIDAGGNRGFFTVFAAQLCRQVVYIEPQLKYRACLERLLRENPTSCAVHTENHLLGSNKNAAVSLDDLMGKYEFPRIGFFKCDIEGAEFEVFAHPEKWISRVENLAMEVHPAFGDPKSISDVLQRNGFSVIVTDNRLRPTDASRASYIYASQTGAFS